MGGAACRHDVGQPHRPAHPRAGRHTAEHGGSDRRAARAAQQLLPHGQLCGADRQAGSFAAVCDDRELADRRLQHCRAGFHRQDRAEHLCCADHPAGRRHPRRGRLRAGWLAAEQRQDGRERADLLCGAAAAHAGGYRRHGDSDRFCAGRGTGGGAADLPPIDQCAVRPCG